jgi:transposase-like protein
MISSVITARLEYSCGHFALVSLPRLKGETATQRTERVNRAKAEARGRACDFCGPSEQALVEVRPVLEALPSAELNGHQRAGDEKENVMTETPSVTPEGTQESRRTFPPRRRLNEEQEREVTRLYTETALSVPDISKQFSIGESSVYRIAARHGARLRGRVAEGAAPGAKAATGRRRGRPAANQPAPDAGITRRRRGRAAAGQATPQAAPAAKATRRRGRRPADASGPQRFEIQFRAETVVRAADVRGALRQVEALGAADVTAIVRLDR